MGIFIRHSYTITGTTKFTYSLYFTHKRKTKALLHHSELCLSSLVTQGTWECDHCDYSNFYWFLGLQKYIYMYTYIYILGARKIVITWIGAVGWVLSITKESEESWSLNCSNSTPIVLNTASTALILTDSSVSS